ncbi:fimbrial protein [Providencia rustigianii]|uniref:fimbrial protein n=1 Tax=Providencia rustigianii TaxID=158850 RepID=UPI00223F30B4|nr:type 1 fimbrial protein [Providencia rustigianii]
MKRINRISLYLWGFLLLNSPAIYGDVLVDVTATMVDPACNLRGEDGNSPLQIHFGTIETHNLNEISLAKDFPVYISGCNGGKGLSILLNPKGYGTQEYSGKQILSTSTKGLGVNLYDVTGGKTDSLGLNQLQPINPELISETKHRINLQAQLVNTLPVSQLSVGKFTSAMMISVTYN